MPAGCVDYLTFLAEQGHELTPVEEVMAGLRTDKQVDLVEEQCRLARHAPIL